MKMTLFFIGQLLIFSNQSVFGSESSLCKPSEKMIASCHLHEGKNRVVSLCASADSTLVFYRIGKEQNMELVSGFSKRRVLSRWVDKATYTTYFGFRLPPYSYVFGVPQQTYGAKAFLEAYRDDKEIMLRVCTENSFGETALISEAIREVPDDLVRGNDFLFPPY
ncbi:hypothetical protein JBE38_07085 [Pseudomonas sp. ICBG1301]|uniref:Uncharacterized protein n=2 Tax=Pseudomonas palleroniana TaxID=191390 RepID=A0A6H9SH17_9PSED|nr:MULTISPECIES: hypothetical protein [Pseudomonas]KAB0568853.1 hypothetical protein F7R03_04560 [Pseudomonas palleroniana]MBM9485671.1 hypothetical protein [Pseudomonas sp. ICBG1301]